ncbi:MAG TPA: RsmB/NOP family class I SAM-dependent RNA methyltransferase [Candidatus Limnocylindrales bacterium]|nr:RsmB/NOP family class I SAM-dependent RNA methyltransferase [Candidatus Limnocylindrales bacterium]
MPPKQFFIDRYSKLGWTFTEVNLRQAIRINQTNAKGKNLPERLRSLGVELEKVPFLPAGYWVENSKVSVGATAEYLLGMYSIQEAAAQIPATLFTALSGKMVLDACAAPGGKTIQLADLMENSGVITALDTSKPRLGVMANHLERCHVSNTIVYNIDARQAGMLHRKFDRVLLDVPCSGNFSCDKEWFSRRTLADIERNAKAQRAILAEAAGCLASGGEIVYSTCSLEPEEDELNMDWAVKNLQLQIQKIDCLGEDGLTEVFGRKLEGQVAFSKRIWPGETQGFFVCKLKKEAEL